MKVFARISTEKITKLSKPHRLSFLSPLLRNLYTYPKFRMYVISIVKRLERGEFHSKTLRQIFLTHHKLEIGNYSYGCFLPSNFPEGTVIGAYTSLAENVICLRRNHPYSRITQHPFFYNKHLGVVDADTINSNRDNPLVIGSDVWIGRDTTILPSCKIIGDGAIIGAGSIVTKDIPSFSIFAGNPAKHIKNRFTDEVMELLSLSRWWDMSLEELLSSEFPCFDEASVDSLQSWLSQWAVGSKEL